VCTFKFPTISNTNMTVMQTCTVEGTVAPSNLAFEIFTVNRQSKKGKVGPVLNQVPCHEDVSVLN